jgi:hypothetical protein
VVTELATEDAEINLHALQTVNEEECYLHCLESLRSYMNEEFQLCWGTVALEHCIVLRKLGLNHGMQLITQLVHVIPCL